MSTITSYKKGGIFVGQQLFVRLHVALDLRAIMHGCVRGLVTKGVVGPREAEWQTLRINTELYKVLDLLRINRELRMSKILSWNETLSECVYGPTGLRQKRGGSIFKRINFVFRMAKGKNKLTEILLVFTKLQVVEENVNLKRQN